MVNRKIPEGAVRIIKTLNDNGFEAYLVGGCVRDALLGRIPGDWDIAASATPDEIESVFDLPGFSVIPTGKKHGTMTVVVRDVDSSGEKINSAPREDIGSNSAGASASEAETAAAPETYEVTTYRIDGEYSDSRHPDSVTFTRSLAEDLHRRDFTINAIAMDTDGNLHDPVGGLDDLRNHVIRAVGDPSKRFEEDALRIMRGIRFEAQLEPYGFAMEGSTENAIHEHRYLLREIAAERIQTELCKLLEAEGAVTVLRKYRDVIAVVLPEIEPGFDFDQHNPFHCYDVYEHILHAVDGIKREDTEEDFLTVRLAALLHDVGKPACFVVKDGWGHFYGHEKKSAEMADAALRRLKFDRATHDDVVFLIEKHGTVFNLDKRYVKRKLNQMGERRLRMLIALEKGDVGAQALTADGGPKHGMIDVRKARTEALDEFSNMVDKVIAEDACFSIGDLAVNGRDVMNLGVPQGPEVGQMLKRLLDEVLDEKLPNEREAMMDAMRSWIEDSNQ